jgi:uncharacterized membrane protein
VFGNKRRSETTTTHRRRRATRPASVIAAVIGILAIVLGVWALIKTGLNTDHIFTPSKEVLGVRLTPAAALGVIGFGILLLFAAATGAFGAFLIAVLGAASLAFGVIVVSDSWEGRVQRWTAANHDGGWMFILVGAVLLLSATLPLFVPKRTVETREPVAKEAEPVPPAREPAAVAEPAAASEPAAVSDTTAREDRRPEPDTSATPTETDADATQRDNTNTPAPG